MAFRASSQHSSSKFGSAFGLRLNSDLMAFRASSQHSSSKFGSAFGLRLNPDLSVSAKLIILSETATLFERKRREAS